MRGAGRWDMRVRSVRIFRWDMRARGSVRACRWDMRAGEKGRRKGVGGLVNGVV